METIAAPHRRTPPLQRPAADQARSGDTRPPLLRRPPVPRAQATDPAQAFVVALRATAPRFAAAAGAATAVVAEAVPPARHRRARCRLVLLAADGAESAQVFVGAAGRPGAGAAAAFTAGIVRWLEGRDHPVGGSDAPAAEVVLDPLG